MSDKITEEIKIEMFSQEPVTTLKSSDVSSLEKVTPNRGFQEVHKDFLGHPGVATVMPYRSTANSAGYDFESKEHVFIKPGESHIFTTDVKSYMLGDEYLSVFPRGGFGFGGKHLMLTNTVGIIDADFYDSPSGGGNIKINLFNNGSEPQEFKVGDRIAQGIFGKYLTVDNDSATGERIGGFHSTGK